MKGLKILGVLVAVLLVLAVVGDIVGRNVAEDKVATAFQERYDLKDKPEVDVHGFSFLVQALSGTYERVDITAKDVPVKDVPPVDVTIQADDLQLPISKAVDGDVSGVPIGHAVASVALPKSVLTDRIGTGVTLTSLGGTKVQADAKTTVLGVDLAFKAVLDVKASGGVVTVQVLELSALDVELPGAVRNALSQELNFTVDLPSIVKALDLTQIRITGGEVILTGEGSNLVLN